MRPIVLAITGASGAIYAARLLELLLAAGRQVHLVISNSGAQVIRQELGLTIDLRKFALDQLSPAFKRAFAQGAHDQRPGLVYHHYEDFSAGIASGSFLTDGMVICPCSMGTLASIAGGHSQNLIQRAADVHLKERRKLLLVPRETPLSSIQLGNMQKLAEAGATLLPAMPGFYHAPRTLDDLVHFIVGRICDHLGVEHRLFERWGDGGSHDRAATP
jgi:4-hydroxy-3-polyprenylbenzoate decarboxylase